MGGDAAARGPSAPRLNTLQLGVLYGNVALYGQWLWGAGSMAPAVLCARCSSAHLPTLRDCG